MSWLEYSQCVLDKVRFDRHLFRKELRKFLRMLTPTERIKLLNWCRLQRSKPMPDSYAIPVYEKD